MTPLLHVNKVSKSFGAVLALRDVSFELHAGEVHALLGENGAEKSTLIKIITGAHAPDHGTVLIAGEPFTNFTPRKAHHRGIACVYQQPALFPDLSVAENIALRLSQPRAFSIVSHSSRQSKALALLQRVGAAIDPQFEIRGLSMPDQQLVEIACAIGSGARIIIMDEPTASLTQKEQHLLFAVVRDLRASGVGVVYISHRLEEIFALADRVTVLRDGESIATRRMDDINESKLIELMVGREISQVFPPAHGAVGDTVLALSGIGCRAGGVHDVTLELRAGEILGLAGLVGAGRTELARVVFGITPADSGTMELRGRRVTIQEPRDAIANGIAYVPEDRRQHGVVLEMPIAQNMTMAVHPTLFKLGWLSGTAENALARGFMSDLDIKASGPQAPGETLSGGNQQKVSVARWLATKPAVLILDEPTQGVDVGAKGEIHRIIRQLAGEGLAVLMISSDLPEILGMSDRIAVMRNGRIVAVLPQGSDAHAVMAAALGKGKAAA